MSSEDGKDESTMSAADDSKPVTASTPPPSPPLPLAQTPKKRTRTARSRFFAAKIPKKSSRPSPVNKEKAAPRPPRGTVSSIPFPPLDAPRFGLVQEELADDPFRLLVVVTFLIRTPGRTAIPAFRKLMERYPTSQDLADADTADIVEMIRHLGLAEVRAAAIQRYARIWLDNPPRGDVRYIVRSYPEYPEIDLDAFIGEAVRDAHVDTDEVEAEANAGAEAERQEQPREEREIRPLNTEDTSIAEWEIGHLTQGRYAIDSWRIFCRDVLRGLAEDWKGKGREGEFQPEWMRVLPTDKELRACLRWMWMQEGWHWDPATGDRELLSEELRRAVQEGRVGYDDTGGLKILGKKQRATQVVPRSRSSG